MWYSMAYWADGSIDPIEEDEDLWQLMIKTHKWMAGGLATQDMKEGGSARIEIRYISKEDIEKELS